MRDRRWEVRWTPRAYEDLSRAHAYVRRHDARAAAHFAARVREIVDLVRRQPDMGKVHEHLAPPGVYRYFVVASYLLIYRVTEDNVVLLVRIWDGRQDPEALAAE